MQQLTRKTTTSLHSSQIQIGTEIMKWTLTSARQESEKTRHVDVRFLWLQQAVQEGRLKVLSVPTTENLSDTFTKFLSQTDADR